MRRPPPTIAPGWGWAVCVSGVLPGAVGEDQAEVADDQRGESQRARFSSRWPVQRVPSTASATSSTHTPCSRLSSSVRMPNSGSLPGRAAGAASRPRSSGSASKTIEQAGSMIISQEHDVHRQQNISGQPNSTGSSDMPTIGTCTASM